MPALRTAFRLILKDGSTPRPASERSGPRPLASRRMRWVTGGGAALVVVTASVLAAPGTAHARAAAAPTSSTGPIRPDPAPAPAPTPASTPTAAPAPAPAAVTRYAVTQTVITLTDTTRPTPARGPVPARPTRSIRTLVLTPSTTQGPLPVIVFAPGFDSEPETYMTLLADWAAAGYLVVAPEAPGSARDLPGAPVRTDIAGQAQDLSFAVTAVLAGAAGPADATRIAVAGHSDGGSAVATLALDQTYHDPRIAAYLVLSGAIPDGVDGPWGATPTAGQLLVVVGDGDEYGNLPASTAVFEIATMPKTLVVAHGGDHIGTYLADTGLAQSVRAGTLSFLAGLPIAGDTSSLTIRTGT